MEIGFVGLGRMGGGMTHRLLDAGHTVFGFARNQPDRDTLAGRGGMPATSLDELVGFLHERPRVLSRCDQIRSGRSQGMPAA